ncbi:MAG: YfhO family protein [Ignavibacteriales bacterium]
MKRNMYLKALLIISAITILMILLTTGINNLFGSTSDWLLQHIIFPDYFRNLFYETGKLFPNFALNVGAGQNIYYLSYYGLLSPYILLSYMLPFIDMTYYLIVLNILIVILSGFLCYVWLMKNKFNNQLSLVVSIIFILIASLIFHSHRHMMFVNYMPFLLLALIGIDKYFSENKKGLYIISVFLMIMTSYYYSVGGLLVLAIYGIYKYLKLNNKTTFKSFIKESFKFLTPMIIGILMSSVLLIPTLSAILSGRVSDGTSQKIIDLLIPKLNIGGLLYNSYGIGFTGIALIALIINLFNKEKSKKILSILILIILVTPIFLYILNGTLYIRSKVLIPFAPLIALLIAIFFTDLESKKISLKKLYSIMIIAIILIFCLGYKEIYFYIDILVTMIVLIFFIYKNKKLLSYLIIILIAVIVNFISNSTENYVSKDYYEKVFDKKYEQLIKSTIDNDDSFYRFNNIIGNTSVTSNKIYDIRYYQTSLYSSTHNNNYYDFFNNIALNPIPHRNNIIMTQTNNVMYETLMGVKYILTDDNIPIGYVKINSNNEIGIYKNNNVLPIGYATASIISNTEFDKLIYPYSLESLINNVAVDKIVNNNITSNIKEFNPKYEYITDKKLKIEKKDDIFIIDSSNKSNVKIMLDKPIKDNILFIRFNVMKAPNCSEGDISIEINNVVNKLTCKQWIYFNDNYYFEYVTSSPNEIKDINVTFSKGHFEIQDIKLHTLDYNLVKEIVNNVDPFIVDSSKTKGDKIVGTINISKDGYFATTIPYDEGFTILVNGKETKYEKVNKAFIGFPINKGQYNIEISYRAKGFNIGSILSIIGIISFMILMFFERKRKKEKK